jgi:hypothetical protein
VPIHHSIDGDRALVRTVGTGEVTFAEVAAHFEALAAELRDDIAYDVLLDLSQCTSLPTAVQLREIAGTLGRFGGRRRFQRGAMVAANDALFGMTRMFEVFAEEQFLATRAFRSAAEAERWLASVLPAPGRRA